MFCSDKMAQPPTILFMASDSAHTDDGEETEIEGVTTYEPFLNPHTKHIYEISFVEPRGHALDDIKDGAAAFSAPEVTIGATFRCRPSMAFCDLHQSLAGFMGEEIGDWDDEKTEMDSFQTMWNKVVKYMIDMGGGSDGKFRLGYGARLCSRLQSVGAATSRARLRVAGAGVAARHGNGRFRLPLFSNHSVGVAGTGPGRVHGRHADEQGKSRRASRRHGRAEDHCRGLADESMHEDATDRSLGDRTTV